MRICGLGVFARYKSPYYYYYYHHHHHHHHHTNIIIVSYSEQLWEHWTRLNQRDPNATVWHSIIIYYYYVLERMTSSSPHAQQRTVAGTVQIAVRWRVVLRQSQSIAFTSVIVHHLSSACARMQNDNRHTVRLCTCGAVTPCWRYTRHDQWVTWAVVVS